jgi:hypothetical protein
MLFENFVTIILAACDFHRQPLVSGLYKLFTVCLRMCSRLSYFKVGIIVVIFMFFCQVDKFNDKLHFRLLVL